MGVGEASQRQRGRGQDRMMGFWRFGVEAGFGGTGGWIVCEGLRDGGLLRTLLGRRKGLVARRQ